MTSKKKRLNNQIWIKLLPAGVGISAALLVFLSFFQRNFFSKTYLLASILIFGATCYFSYRLNILIGEKIRRLDKKSLSIAVLFSIILTLLLQANFSLIPFYAILPKSKIEITAFTGDHAEDDEKIVFLYLENALGYIPVSDLMVQDGAAQSNNEINFSPSDLFSIEWEGVPGEFLDIAFRPAENDLYVDISIDQQNESFNLFRTSGEFDAVFSRKIGLPLYSRLPFILSFLFFFSYTFFAFFILNASRKTKEPQRAYTVQFSFIYSIPFVITSLASLLVFWPGIMSRDSMAQWVQVAQGSYSAWFSTTLNLAIALITAIWNFPATVALFQIALLAFVFTQGFRFLRRYGAPEYIMVIISILIAFWPLTPIFAITLWKDIPYSAALFGLFIFTLEIVFSQGKWIGEKNRWILLGLFAFLTAAIRQNGIAVAILTLGLMVAIFKSHRKKLAMSFLLCLALFGVIEVGLKKSLVDESVSSGGQVNIVLLPHLAAHLENGTELQEDERNYLNALMPLEAWEYECCYIGNISYNQGFDRPRYLDSFQENLGLAAALFMRDPLVDIRHQACASEIFWRFIGNTCSQKSAHGFTSVKPGAVSWITPNQMGITENSFFPELVEPYINCLQKFGIFSDQSLVLLRPAFYLLLTILAIAAATVQLRDASILAGLIPVITQTVVLLLINFSPSYRYQYGVCLIGLFCLGLFFIPKANNSAEN
ncbi:MAG TPA: hypothetical protein VMW28_02745 [Pelolinea sp.]|nr:hypothetical protein [Pelolinea sp.]